MDKQTGFFGVLLFGIIVFSIPFVSFANPGDTDIYGCHTCVTNCLAYGNYEGQYHCHETPPGFDECSYILDKMATQSFIEKQFRQCLDNYQSSQVNTVEPSPAYVPASTQGNTQSTDYSDYLESNKQSIEDSVNDSMREWCVDNYGKKASWDSDAERCECRTGYTFDLNKQCSPKEEVYQAYCVSQVGIESHYDATTDKCLCNDGYSYSTISKSCVNSDQVCMKLNNNDPNMIIGDDKKSCVCKIGYKWDIYHCVVTTSIAITPPPVTPIIETAKEAYSWQEKAEAVVPVEVLKEPTVEATSTTDTIQSTSIEESLLTPLTTSTEQADKQIDEKSSNETAVQKIPWYKKIWRFIWRF